MLKKLLGSNRPSFWKKLEQKVGKSGFWNKSGQKTNSRGFTLIELMVVIAILALLGGVVAPRFFTRIRKAKPDTAKIDIKQISLALDMYAADNGEYPTTEQGLQALITLPTSPPEPMNWSGPYVEPTRFLDPWKNPYVYESPSNHEGYDYDMYFSAPMVRKAEKAITLI